MSSLNILPSLGKKYPFDVPFSQQHMTNPNLDDHKKIVVTKRRNILAYSFQTCKLNPYVVRDTRGSGTLYNTKKSRYFLIELDPNADLCLKKKNSFNIYTNDNDMTNDHQRFFNSTSTKVNLNYLIGTYLCFTFAINRQFSPDIVKKYFKRLRQLLIDKFEAIKNRISHSAKNRQTKTYIRFSSGAHVIYLGFYLRCGKDCNQPAAFVLPKNQWKCNRHFIPIPGSRSQNAQQKGKSRFNPSLYHQNSSCVRFNQAKEVHSTRLGLKYDFIVKRYNEWRGKNNSDLKKAMEPITTSKQGERRILHTTRPFYKEYSNLEFDADRSPQQIQRWKRLRNLVIHQEEDSFHTKPFLLKENSMVFKKLSHNVERNFSRFKTDEEKSMDKLNCKRAKNWLRHVKKRNKLKKRLPDLPPNFNEDARAYYFKTYNINLYAYKVRRRFDLSNIPGFNYGYIKAKRLYNNYQTYKRSRINTTLQQLQPPPPSIVYPGYVSHLPENHAKLIMEELNSSQDSAALQHLSHLIDDPIRWHAIQSHSKKDFDSLITNPGQNSTISQSTNPLLNDASQRPIAKPRSLKGRSLPNPEHEVIETPKIIDNRNTPPPDFICSNTNSPGRLIARPRSRKNYIPPTPRQEH